MDTNIICDPRSSWDEYFLKMVSLIASRSTCLRRQVGAILVKDNRILGTGYNGAPEKLKHCFEAGCIREKLNIPSGERHELCRAIHAEQNAVIQAAIHGIIVTGATLYCTTRPCSICAKILINVGITRLVFVHNYPSELSEELLDEAGFILVKNAPEIEKNFAFFILEREI